MALTEGGRGNGTAERNDEDTKAPRLREVQKAAGPDEAEDSGGAPKRSKAKDAALVRHRTGWVRSYRARWVV